jgi:hypothetical protein
MKKTKMLMILLCIIGIAFLTADAFAQKTGGELKPVYYIQSVKYQPQKGDNIRIPSTPGRTLIITGNLFERRPGKVALKGLLKLSGPAPDMELVVTKWNNTLITANVPQATGLLDSNATLVVTRVDGKKTQFPMKFRATRETLFVPHDVIQLTCPNPDSKCTPGALKCSYRSVPLLPGEPGYVPGQTLLRDLIYSGRMCEGPGCAQVNGKCPRPLSGADTFTVALKNGWVLKNDISRFTSEPMTYANCTRTPSITGPNSGQVSWETKCVQFTDPRGNPKLCSNGCPEFFSLCSAEWTWSLLMEGPKGVPFR